MNTDHEVHAQADAAGFTLQCECGATWRVNGTANQAATSIYEHETGKDARLRRVPGC